MLPDFQFPLYSEILYHSLNPNLASNADGKKFTILLQDMESSPLAEKGTYHMHYLRPISTKSAYYERQLLRETAIYCESVCEMLAAEKDDRMIAYLRDQIVDKHLTNSLQRLGEVIAEYGYQLEELENPSNSTDRERLSSVYIFHLLKVCLAKAYLEVQEVLEHHVSRTMSEEDLYLQLVGELPPVRSFLVKQRVESAVDSTNDNKGYLYKFLATYPDDLKDLHDGLVKAELIEKDTPFSRFKVLFSDKPVEHPVVWTGNVSELCYFIKLIHNVYEAVEDTRQRQWDIACRCFVKADGTPFDRDKLKGQKKPAKSAELIEKMANLLEY